MDITTRDEAFHLLGKLSDTQCDPQVKKRLKTFIGRAHEDIKDELLGMIDDSVYCSWTSNFEIMMMNYIWVSIGGSEQELKERNTQLDNPDKKEEFKKRFKWTAAGTH